MRNDKPVLRTYLINLFIRVGVVPERDGADSVEVHLQTPLAVDAGAAVNGQWLAQ